MPNWDADEEEETEAKVVRREEKQQAEHSDAGQSTGNPRPTADLSGQQ